MVSHCALVAAGHTVRWPNKLQDGIAGSKLTEGSQSVQVNHPQGGSKLSRKYYRLQEQDMFVAIK